MWNAIGSLLWHFVSNIDPNLAFLTITTLGTWLWHKVSGQTRDQANKIVNAVIDNLLTQLMASLPDPAHSVSIDQYIKNASAWMESEVWSLLAKRGVPRNSTTEAYVHEAIVRADTALRPRVQQRRDALDKQQAQPQAGAA